MLNIRDELDRRMDKLWDMLPDADDDPETWTTDEYKALGAYMELESIFDKFDDDEQRAVFDLDDAAEDYDNNNLFPEVSLKDAFKDGAKWQKDRALEKCCKWLEENAFRYVGDATYNGVEITGLYNQQMIKDFKEAMDKEI